MHVSCSLMICLPAYIIQGHLGIIKANSITLNALRQLNKTWTGTNSIQYPFPNLLLSWTNACGSRWVAREEEEMSSSWSSTRSTVKGVEVKVTHWKANPNLILIDLKYHGLQSYIHTWTAVTGTNLKPFSYILLSWATVLLHSKV